MSLFASTRGGAQLLFSRRDLITLFYFSFSLFTGSVAQHDEHLVSTVPRMKTMTYPYTGVRVILGGPRKLLPEGIIHV